MDPMELLWSLLWSLLETMEPYGALMEPDGANGALMEPLMEPYGIQRFYVAFKRPFKGVYNVMECVITV